MLCFYFFTRYFECSKKPAETITEKYFIPMHFVTLAALVILGKEPQTVPGIPVLDMTQVIYNVPWLIRSSSTGRAVCLKSTCTAKMQHSTHR